MELYVRMKKAHINLSVPIAKSITIDKVKSSLK